MQPQGLLSQINQSMQQGVPALGQVSGTSPNFDPGLQVPPPSPMPDGSPMSSLHRALARRGHPIPAQLGGQAPVSGQTGQLTLPTPPDTNPAQPGTQVTPSEAELIIKALTSRLKTVGDHESAIRDAVLPAQNPQDNV